MSVRQRKRDKRWMVDIVYEHPTNGKIERLRRISPVQTKRGAESYERELRQALLSGAREQRKEVEPPPTLSEFSDEFLNVYCKANNKWSEVENKRAMMSNHLLPMFGDTRLDCIDERAIERYKARKQSEGMCAKTINNHLACLSKLLSLAKEWRLINNVPTIRWLKTTPPDFDFLTFEEADLLLKHVEEEWRIMVMMALTTGMRHGELLALEWPDINFPLKLISVKRAVFLGKVGTPKSGKPRDIPMCDSLFLALHEYRQGQKTGLVFTNPQGLPLTAAQCRSPLDRACAKAELRHISWHVFRHTFASHLVMRGAPITVVQELLGHSTITMTMRYSHLSPKAKQDAVNLLQVYGSIAAPTEKGFRNYAKSLVVSGRRERI